MKTLIDVKIWRSLQKSVKSCDLFHMFTLKYDDTLGLRRGLGCNHYDDHFPFILMENTEAFQGKHFDCHDYF